MAAVRLAEIHSTEAKAPAWAQGLASASVAGPEQVVALASALVLQPWPAEHEAAHALALESELALLFVTDPIQPPPRRWSRTAIGCHPDTHSVRPPRRRNKTQCGAAPARNADSQNARHDLPAQMAPRRARLPIPLQTGHLQTKPFRGQTAPAVSGHGVADRKSRPGWRCAGSA